MEKLNIDELKAGREMDKLIYARVFGLCDHEWELAAGAPDHNDCPQCLADWPPKRCVKCNKRIEGIVELLDSEHSTDIPRYSTDIAKAWKAVERLQSLVPSSLDAKSEVEALRIE